MREADEKSCVSYLLSNEAFANFSSEGDACVWIELTTVWEVEGYSRRTSGVDLPTCTRIGWSAAERVPAKQKAFGECFSL